MTGSTPVETILALESGPNISTARNKITADFLTRKSPWLLMVDTDMVFTHDAVTRLVAAADPDRRPVIGGLCWTLAHGEQQATMYELVRNDTGMPALVALTSWPEDQPVRVTSTGTAFLLMHRRALRKIAKHANDVAAPWFRETATGPMALMGEDMTFCLRAGAAGVPVHVHTGVQVGHMKTTMIGKAA